MFIIEEILDILPRSIELEEEDSYENPELIECLWKHGLTLPSEY